MVTVQIGETPVLLSTIHTYQAEERILMNEAASTDKQSEQTSVSGGNGVAHIHSPHTQYTVLVSVRLCQGKTD